MTRFSMAGGRLLLVIGALGAFGACATTVRPIEGPRHDVADAAELFRRARFEELASTHGAWSSWVDEYLPAQLQAARAENEARAAYRAGDPAQTQIAVERLPPSSHTRKLLVALLDNADTDRPLRRGSRAGGTIVLPLDPQALARGYPVVAVDIGGRTLHMVWDTGATENVMSPATVEELDLLRTDVQFPVLRDKDGYVIRFAASATEEVAIGDWRLENVPWLVTELHTVDGLGGQVRIDGFLSPQLLVPGGCFAIDRRNRALMVGFAADACREMVARSERRGRVFSHNGEVYVSARVHESPELAVQLETGSPVTFLRADATRYLPAGLVQRTLSEGEGEIAHGLGGDVTLMVAGRPVRLDTIDLEQSRASLGHDDIATLGTDLLLDGDGLVVSFATMEIGFLPPAAQIASVSN